MKLPDIYKGQLNTDRIKAYRLFAETFNISSNTVGKIFNEGADWYKSQIKQP